MRTRDTRYVDQVRLTAEGTRRPPAISFIAKQVETAIEIGSSVSFLGTTYTANRFVAYVVGMALPAWPEKDELSRFMTAETLRASYESMRAMQVDLRHELPEHGWWGEASIVGNVAEVELRNDQLFVLTAIWKERNEVRKILDEVRDGKFWGFSYETENETPNTAYEDGAFRPLTATEQDMLRWDGHLLGMEKPGLLLCVGGENGRVTFSGLALTPNPAYRQTAIVRMAASRNGHARGGEDTVTIEELEAQMKDMGGRLDKLIASLDGDKKAEVEALKASLGEVKTHVEAMKAQPTAETLIAEKVEAGDLVEKDKHETLVAEAVTAREKEMKDEADEKDRQATLTAERTKALTDIGVDLTAEAKEDDPIQKVARSGLATIGFAKEDGEKFTAHLETVKGLVEMKAGDGEGEGARTAFTASNGGKGTGAKWSDGANS